MNKTLLYLNEKSISLTIFFCLVILGISGFLSHQKNPSDIIKHDAVQYYIYLPAFFIYNDVIELNFRDQLTEKEVVDFYWVLTSGNGKKHIKYTMGVAILYAPFFLLAHGFASLSDTYVANGFTTPYHIGVLLSGLFFLMIGLLNLKVFLLNYFEKKVVAFTLFLVVIGTNLFNYSTFEAGMSHIYTFSLLSIALNHLKKWLVFKNNNSLYLVGFMIGLMVLIRPINILIVLFFTLFEVDTLNSLKNRLNLFKVKYKAILIAAFCAFLVFIPQLIYWKLATGNWVYYSYDKSEGFFFNDPKIIEGLISYRKGWLVYTPIMFFALMAFFFRSKRMNSFKMNILLLIIPYFYISFSWWCWWYGGSFGMRPLIDLYPIFSILLAFFISKLFKASLVNKIVVFTLFTFCVYLNVLQTYKYQKGFLHHDSMTERTYWNYFLKKNTHGVYWETLNSPNYENAKLGDRDL